MVLYLIIKKIFIGSQEYNKKYKIKIQYNLLNLKKVMGNLSILSGKSLFIIINIPS
jgi:hypothetical protein